MKECPKCGLQIEDDAEFCTNCGIKQDSINFMTDEEKKDYFKTEKKYGCIGAIIYLILSVAAAVFLYCVTFAFILISIISACCGGSFSLSINELMLFIVPIVLLAGFSIGGAKSIKQYKESTENYNIINNQKCNNNETLVDNIIPNYNVDNNKGLFKYFIYFISISLAFAYFIIFIIGLF